MTPDEVLALIAYASAIDPRVRRNDPAEGDLQVEGWHAQLGRFDFAVARAAVDGHYARADAQAVLPGDIRARCATGSSGPPNANGGAVLAAIDAHVEVERVELNRRVYEIGELPA